MITANLYFRQEWEVYKHGQIIPAMARNCIKIKDEIADTDPVLAHVNHGQWLVRCECGGYEYAWEEGKFMCQSCWNGQHKHALRQLKFPLERQQIESILMARPLDNRNWKHPETTADLIHENEAHKAELIGV